MARTTGVTNKTSKRIVIDSAAIYVNYGEDDERLLGATEGGATFLLEQTIRMPEIDGLPGPLAGTRRVTNVVAQITTQLMELTTENLLLCITGATAADSEEVTPLHEVITRASYVFADTLHVTNIAVVGRVSGTNTPIVCMIKNAIADGNVEIGFVDDDEAKPEITFTGHFTADDLENEPWEIRNPIIRFTFTYTAGAGGAITGSTPQTVEMGADGAAVTANPNIGFEFATWSDGVLTATRTDLDAHKNITVSASFTAS